MLSTAPVPCPVKTRTLPDVKVTVTSSPAPASTTVVMASRSSAQAGIIQVVDAEEVQPVRGALEVAERVGSLVEAGVEDEGVGAAVAEQEVVAGCRDQLVPAGAAIEHVARAADHGQQVGAAVAEEFASTGGARGDLAREDIVAVPAAQRVDGGYRYGGSVFSRGGDGSAQHIPADSAAQHVDGGDRGSVFCCRGGDGSAQHIPAASAAQIVGRRERRRQMSQSLSSR